MDGPPGSCRVASGTWIYRRIYIFGRYIDGRNLRRNIGGIAGRCGIAGLCIANPIRLGRKQERKKCRECSNDQFHVKFLHDPNIYPSSDAAVY